MKTNLTGLERERRRLAPGRSRATDNERRELIRIMNRRDCFNNNSNQRVATARTRNRSLIEQIFGVRTYSDGERPGTYLSSRYNTFRTMCVRKKDGYYFPISFSTTPDRFEYDESVCQSKCGNTQVALYYHAMPDQDSQDMISFRGQEPYADLPNAFAYRKKFDPEASCRFTSGVFQEIAGSNGERNSRADQTGAILSRIATPAFRIDRSIDPESAANALGNFDATQIARLFAVPQKQQVARPAGSGNKNVRVVGPAFYPVQ